jgi:hypothetical protein
LDVMSLGLSRDQGSAWAVLALALGAFFALMIVGSNE